ncbi:hypothetical protein COSO111634_20870 [Corallococcus soli]
MYGVKPSRLLKASSASARVAGKSSTMRSEVSGQFAGRGRSVGRPNWRGIPASRWRHHCSCSGKRACASDSRCHAPKSAYCTDRGASGEGLPWRKAA